MDDLMSVVAPSSIRRAEISCNNTPTISEKTISPEPMSLRKRNEDSSYLGRLLTISPAEELQFTWGENGQICDTISLNNNLSNEIAYKIQTTYPDRYKIQPRSGIVKAGSCTDVCVFLQDGYCNSTIQKDKVRVMWVEVLDSSGNARELWKSIPKESINEHRLRCVYITNHLTQGDGPGKGLIEPSIMSKQLEKLISSTSYLKSHVQWMTLSLVVLIISVTAVVSVVYYILNGMIDSCYSPVF